MAQTIQIKRSSSTSAPGSLLEGEFAWVDHGTGGAAGKLYIGDAAAGAVTDISGSSYLKVLSGSMTGSATAPTQSPGNNSTRIATTAYVDAAILTEDTVLEMGDTDIRDIVASSYAAESQVDINASGISEFVVAGEADDDVDFTTESNYIQQEWTNSNQSTSQITIAAAGVGAIDVDTEGSGTERAFGRNTGEVYITQSYTAVTSSAIGQISVALRKAGNPTMNLNCKIFAESGDLITGSALATSSTTLDCSTITGTDQAGLAFYDFAFSGFSQTANTKYVIQFITDAQAGSHNPVAGESTSSSYANGRAGFNGSLVGAADDWDVHVHLVGQAATLSSGNFPTNCLNSRIQINSDGTWRDISTRTSNTELALSSYPSNGTYDYEIRFTEFDSGSVKLNSIANTSNSASDVTDSTSFTYSTSGNASGRGADKMFDNSLTNSSNSCELTSTTGWAQIDFGADNAKSAWKITYQDVNDVGTASVGTLQVEGSNDGSSYDVLVDSQTVPAWSSNPAAVQTYMISTTTAYRYFKFVVEANGGHGAQVNLGEVQIFPRVTTGNSNPITEYVSVATSESHNPNTDGWLDLNSASITETTDSNSNAHYWLGFDPTSNYGPGTEIVVHKPATTVSATDVTSGQTFTESNAHANMSVYSAGSAFDDSASTYWLPTNSTAVPEWIKVQFDSAQHIDKITLNSGNSVAYSYTVDGSNDDVNWTTLLSITSKSYGSNTVVEESLTTTGSYTYYRLYFTACVGSNFYIREIEMIPFASSTAAHMRPIAKNNAGTWEYNSSATSTYTGTSATTNDMLHAVSEAVSTVSANRMTETQAEAISDADFELTGGFTAGTTSSVFRGTTLYSTDDESNPSVDQYSLNFTGELGDNMFGRVDANQSIGQIFQSTSDDELHSAKMFIKTIGSPTDNVVLKLYSVTGSVGQELPNALLATSDAVAASAMSSSYAEHTFTFSTTVNMVDGTKYAIVCDRSGSDSNTNYYRAQGQDTDVYNSGHLVELDSSWTATVLKDLSLQVFGSVLQSVGTGRILIYDGVDSWDDKDVSGVITMTKEGVTSLTSASIVDVDISVSAAIANAKLANSTISGKALGANLDSLTLGAGFGAGTYNGSTAVTANVDGVLEDLDTLGAAASDGQFIVATGTGAFAYESGNTARTSLGLGSSDAPTFTGMDASSTAITNVGLPINAQELATLAYVASVEYGMDFKDSVTAATTADMSATYANGTAGVGATLTGSAALGAIDGITLVANDRLLVKNQSTASENGIYVATTITDPFVLTRSVDADQDSEFTAGAFVFVEQGTIAADNAYINISDGDITFGTTSINWTPFTGAGMITAGTGLSKSGNTLSIDTSYVGQASITTLGTIASGVWESTRVGATYGGTGTDSSSETGIPQIVNGTWTFPSTVAPVYGGLGIDTSGSTGVGSVSGGTWSISSILSNTLGGTGTDSSSETGIPQVVGGTWTYPSEVLPLYGGTGLDTSSSTGVVSVSGGTWSVGTSVPVTQGGSGNTSMTTGDMMMASDTEEMTMLAAGSAGMVMQTSDAIMPTWNAIDGQIMSSMMDSVSITSSGVNTKIGTAGDSPEKVGQTITTTDTGTLNYAKFKLKRIGNPSDTYVAKVAAVTTTSGTIHNNLSSNTNASGSGVYEGCIFAGGAYQAYSSNFTPSSDTAISTIAFEVKADSPSSTQEYTLEIYPTSSGKPVRTNGNNFSGSGVSGFNSGRGASLVASNTYNTGGLSSTSWSTVTATFSTSYTLTSGTEYAVVFCPVGSSSGSRVYFRTQAGTNSEAWGYDGGWTTGSYSPTLEIGMNISSSITGPGSALATSGARNASDVSRAYQMMEFTFSGANKITLANATKYAFYLERTGTADTSNILATDTQSSSSYAGGDAISHDGTSWSTHTDREHNLQVWTDDV